MQNMQCMMMTGPASVIIGGHQTKVIELEVEHKEVIREVKDIFLFCCQLYETFFYIESIHTKNYFSTQILLF